MTFSWRNVTMNFLRAFNFGRGAARHPHFRRTQEEGAEEGRADPEGHQKLARGDARHELNPWSETNKISVPAGTRESVHRHEASAMAGLPPLPGRCRMLYLPGFPSFLGHPATIF